MHFRKYHGLGNDYIIISPDEAGARLTPGLIRSICDRHHGPGSDGILLGPHTSRSADFKVQIFNPDGSEAQKSGNGLRIFARSLFDDGRVQSGQAFTVETAGGLVECTVLKDHAGVRIDMGKVSFCSTDLPATGAAREMLRETIEAGGNTLTFCGVSVGNPHCVVLMDRVPVPSDAETTGPLIETHPLFPERTNVQFMYPLDEHNIRIEIWERGAGYTLASGSSSTAAAAVAAKLGFCSSPITVHMPGGTLLIELTEKGSAIMTGPVQAIYEGRLLPDMLQ
jgi:diaminopimelate epimerase